jgi:hypothetical protein
LSLSLVLFPSPSASRLPYQVCSIKPFLRSYYHSGFGISTPLHLEVRRRVLEQRCKFLAAKVVCHRN